MVVKFYISMISGNKEIKKRQMKAQLIMESKGVDFKVIDICDPNNEDERRFMQKNAESKGARNPVPPQFFNDEEYCGDYDGFDEANETDHLEEFLKLPRGTLPQVPIINHNLSNFSSREVSMEKEIVNTNVNGFASSRETPEKIENMPTTQNEELNEEDEEEEEDEGEPSGSMVAENINEDVVLKQQSSTVESQNPQSDYSEDEEDEEEQTEERKPDASENLNGSPQSSGINSMAANELRDQIEPGASETRSSSPKARKTSTVEDATEADIVRNGHEQSPGGDEHDEGEGSSQVEAHGNSDQMQATEHELVSVNESPLGSSSDVSVNEHMAPADDVQKHAIATQDDSQGQQSSGAEHLLVAKQSSDNGPALSGESVAANEEAENEEQDESEEEEEDDEEDEENKKIISALPDEDDLMEMSTTVATAERFTEFSYKQLPGEA